MRVLLLVVVLATGCGTSSAPSPFVDTDAEAGAPDDGGDSGDAGDTEGDGAPLTGKPCIDDEQCDDSIECTLDRCEFGHCRSDPDHDACRDDVYCDGLEVCDGRFGCREGEPVSCSDKVTCTIDRCLEATQSCEHAPRDADGDGDPVWNCPGGGDCNDADPRRSSKTAEICGNEQDDDCDTRTDESDCVRPAYDTCIDPFVVTTSGTHSLPLGPAAGDLAASCAAGGGSWRDIVVAVVIPEGPALDVDLIAQAPAGEVSLASVIQCGDASTELGCVRSTYMPDGGAVARLRLRALEPGAYPVYVFTNTDTDAILTVSYLSAAPKATNETCASAIPISPGNPTLVSLVDTTADLPTACSVASGELVYRFELDEARDVRLFAAARDKLGIPVLSLRNAACADLADEVTCRSGQPSQLFARALAPGIYHAAVYATGPSEIDLSLELSAPSTAPADETCTSPPSLLPNRTIDVSLAQHTDDVKTTCLLGAVDAAYQLSLAETSDLLLVARLSSGDVGAVSLSLPACGSEEDVVACTSSSVTPIRAARHGQPAGDYRAIVESVLGNPMTLSAFVRSAVAPTLVAFADSCAQAIQVPTQGGFFQGSTTNMTADYGAGCDLGGQAAGGAPDQMLKLVLDERQRVILDMRGSKFQTLLNVRRGPSCPGAELVRGCTAGYQPDRSFLDLTLDPGEYFIQIDGYAGGRGSWVLDAFIVDP